MGRAVAFDKTGTLTVGRPRLTDVVPVEADEAELLAKAAAVEGDSSHPIAAAIVATAQSRGIEPPRVFGSAVAIPGKAVRARIRDGFLSVGSPRYAAEQAEVPEPVAARIDELEDRKSTRLNSSH